MKVCLIALSLIVPFAASAVDVSPSKTVQPEKFMEPNGKRFSIFSGDPERVQKANEINFGDFETKLDASPNPISAKQVRRSNAEPVLLKIVLSFKNNGKKTYTLSFPTAQRYDILIKNSSGHTVYTWSADKEFVQSIGTTLINPGDRVTYSESVSVQDLPASLPPGDYSIEAVVNNYPELNQKTTLTLTP
jgi:hypothetical protein